MTTTGMQDFTLEEFQAHIADPSRSPTAEYEALKLDESGGIFYPKTVKENFQNVGTYVSTENIGRSVKFCFSNNSVTVPPELRSKGIKIFRIAGSMTTNPMLPVAQQPRQIIGRTTASRRGGRKSRRRNNKKKSTRRRRH